MVTIEQKLTLFSKLLNQDIREEMDEKFAQLQKEYEKLMVKSKYQTDEEAKAIVDDAKKRAEIKKTEIISRSKLHAKKQMMQVKDQIVAKFLKALEGKVADFTASDNYRTYLEEVIQSLDELKNCENPLLIYVTEQDYQKHQDLIKQELIKLGIKENQIQFEITSQPILGGLIIVDEKYNISIDGSISNRIEEAKENIIESISLEIEKVGEANHE